MAIHIKELRIDRFKGIDNITLKNLGDVNIVLGDNNAGKTSILELLQWTHEPASFWNMRNSFRDTHTLGKTMFEGMLSTFPIDGDMKVQYGFSTYDGDNDVVVEGIMDLTQIEEREIHRLNGYMPTGNTKNRNLDTLRDVKCLRIDISLNNKKISHYDIFDFLRRTPNDSVIIEFFPTLFIPPASISQGFTNLSAVLENPKMMDNLVNILKVYDDSVIAVQAIQDNYTVDYKIVSNKHKKAVPISYYGDGMKKAIELFSAAVFISGGILLIDEFETSIHTSAMTDTYRRLMEVAKEMDVQVFMSTHSKEALDKLMDLDVLDDIDFKVHTIFNEDGKHLVRTLDLQEARKATKQWGIDLR